MRWLSRTTMPLRVLIVDDSARMREAAKDVLRTIVACTVSGEETNGLEALELAKALRPDLIVLDINMPIMGGLEALRFLKKRVSGHQGGDEEFNTRD